jgi:fructose-specific phosphotransferase system IIA component
MDFRTALKNGCFCLNLKSDTKRGLIEEMVDAIVAAGKLTDRDEALNAVLDREEKMSTGVQHGVAIPHGKLNSIESLVTAFGMKKEGVDFGSLDGEPSRIFVMTLSSNLRTGPHLQFLSEICKMLNNADVRERLLAVNTPEEVIAILAG